MLIGCSFARALQEGTVYMYVILFCDAIGIIAGSCRCGEKGMLELGALDSRIGGDSSAVRFLSQLSNRGHGR